MNINERENLKKRIEADLDLLAKESWGGDVTKKLEEVSDKLKSISLEGYDD